MDNDRSKPVRFGARTGLWGDERVGVTAVREWETYEEEGIALIDRCDKFLKSLKKDSFESAYLG